MSEALDRIRDLMQTGFAFLPHGDETGEIVMLQAIRTHGGHIDTVLIHGEYDALAARCRDEPRATVVWHQAGPTVEVITALLALPAPGTRGAPQLAGRTPSDLWLPAPSHLGRWGALWKAAGGRGSSPSRPSLRW